MDFSQSVLFGALLVVLIEVAVYGYYRRRLAQPRKTATLYEKNFTPSYPPPIRDLMMDVSGESIHAAFEGLSDARLGSPETCRWLNLILKKILADMIGTAKLEDSIRGSLNNAIKEIAETHRIASEIMVVECTLGNSMLLVEQVTMQRPRTIGDDIVVYLDVFFDGKECPPHLDIEYSNLINVTVAAGVKRIKGRLMVRITNTAQVRLSFVTPPEIEFLFRVRIAHVNTPKAVLGFITKRIREVINFKMVEPRFVAFDLGPKRLTEHRISVTVLGCSALPEPCDVFFSVSCGRSGISGPLFTSEVVRDSANPRWDVTFPVCVDEPLATIEVDLFSENTTKRMSSAVLSSLGDAGVDMGPVSLGFVSVPIAAIPHGRIVREDYPLQRRSRGSDAVGGRLQLELHALEVPKKAKNTKTTTTGGGSEREVAGGGTLDAEGEQPPEEDGATGVYGRSGDGVRFVPMTDVERKAVHRQLSTYVAPHVPETSPSTSRRRLRRDGMHHNATGEHTLPSYCVGDEIGVRALALLDCCIHHQEARLSAHTEEYLSLRDIGSEARSDALVAMVRQERTKTQNVRDERRTLYELMLRMGWPNEILDATVSTVSARLESVHALAVEDTTRSLAVTGINHSFGVVTFERATCCALCGCVMWGLTDQGMRCRICAFPAHKRCAKNMPACCPL